MCCDIQAFPSSIIKLLKLFKTSSFGALFTFAAFTSDQHFVALVIINKHISIFVSTDCPYQEGKYMAKQPTNQVKIFISYLNQIEPYIYLIIWNKSA